MFDHWNANMDPTLNPRNLQRNLDHTFSADSIQLFLTGPHRLKKWCQYQDSYDVRPIQDYANGQITSDSTYDLETMKPIPGGLFCDVLFGGIFAGYVDAKPVFHYDFKVTRRRRLAYIGLRCPLMHIWHLKSTVSHVSHLVRRRHRRVKGLIANRFYTHSDGYSFIPGAVNSRTVQNVVPKVTRSTPMPFSSLMGLKYQRQLILHPHFHAYQSNSAWKTSLLQAQWQNIQLKVCPEPKRSWEPLDKDLFRPDQAEIFHVSKSLDHTAYVQKTKRPPRNPYKRDSLYPYEPHPLMLVNQAWLQFYTQNLATEDSQPPKLNLKAFHQLAVMQTRYQVVETYAAHQPAYLHRLFQIGLNLGYLNFHTEGLTVCQKQYFANVNPFYDIPEIHEPNSSDVMPTWKLFQKILQQRSNKANLFLQGVYARNLYVFGDQE